MLPDTSQIVDLACVLLSVYRQEGIKDKTLKKRVEKLMEEIKEDLGACALDKESKYAACS